MYCISAAVILLASLALMVQDSLLYNKTGRASVLYNYVGVINISLKWESHFTDPVCMEKSHSFEANNFSSNQHISSSHILWIQNPNYHIHNSSPLCCTVKKLKASDVLTPCLLRKYFNIVQTCF